MCILPALFFSDLMGGNPVEAKEETFFLFKLKMKLCWVQGGEFTGPAIHTLTQLVPSAVSHCSLHGRRRLCLNAAGNEFGARSKAC